jgi:ATP-binding protein involved in chromosome partitioning
LSEQPPIPPQDNPLEKIQNTIAVASGKGGVGKSTVSVNLAVALAQTGSKVGLMDADVYGPNVPMMLGATEPPKVVDKRIHPVEHHGIKMISMGFFLKEDEPVVWRGPMIHGAIRQFLTDVEWGDLDYLLIDLPPGTGDVQLTLSQTIPLTGAVIVTTPQSVSTADAQKALRMFEKVRVPILGLIENMSYFICPSTGDRFDIFGKGGGEKMADHFGYELLGQIPIHMSVREGGDAGLPVTLGEPDSDPAQFFLRTADRLKAICEEVKASAPNRKSVMFGGGGE